MPRGTSARKTTHVFTLPRTEIANSREILVTPHKKYEENIMPRKSPGIASAPTRDVEKMRKENSRKMRLEYVVISGRNID